MAQNSKRAGDLAKELRTFKAELKAIGLADEQTSKLDGFASQVEALAAESEQEAETEEDTADLPTGKIDPTTATAQPVSKAGTPDAQTQLDIQKGKSDPNVPAISTFSGDKAEVASKAEAKKS